MNNYRHSKEPMLEGRGDDPTDRLLREYFRREMPRPWPAAPAVRLKNAAPVSRTLRFSAKSRRRIALAASIGLFLGGSWLLGLLFPNSPLDLSREQPKQRIGSIPRDRFGQPIPVREHKLKSGSTIIDVGEIQDLPLP